MSSVFDYDRVPDWKFGDVLRCTTEDSTLLLFLDWTNTVDYNWSESIFKGLCIASDKSSMAVGVAYERYCGWYRPVDWVKDE